MNGIGPNTKIVETSPIVFTVFQIFTYGFTFLFCLSIVFFIIKKTKFKKSDAYAA